MLPDSVTLVNLSWRQNAGMRHRNDAQDTAEFIPCEEFRNGLPHGRFRVMVNPTQPWRIGGIAALGLRRGESPRGAQTANLPRDCKARTAGESMSIQVRKSIVRNSRSMAGGPQMPAPNAR